jgi:hypothetical protein
MTRRHLLVAASAAQLAGGLGGLAIGIARRRAYDIPLLHGDPDRVKRDALVMGTALSAPAPMLAVQSVATVALAARPDPRAVRTLGVLGLMMTAGYLVERLVRHRLTPAGWEATETPIAVVGLGFAVAMAALGCAGPRRP